MIRNFINVSGITEECDLPKECLGQFVEYSETDYIFIPDSEPPINNIYEIMVGIQVINSRIVNMKKNKIYILDGIKHFKIISSAKNKNNKAIVIKIQSPFNTFFDIENSVNVKSANVYILDAYFHLINSRTIYTNITYLLSIEYSQSANNNSYNSNKLNKPKKNDMVYNHDDTYEALELNDNATNYHMVNNSFKTKKVFINQEIEDSSNDNLNYDEDLSMENSNITLNTKPSNINEGLDEQSLTKLEQNFLTKYIDLYEEYL